MIALDCRYIRERPSGIGPYVEGLVEHLPRLAPDLHFLLLKHPLAPARLSLAPNVHEVVVPYDPNGPETMWLLPRLVDFRGVSLYHGTFNILPAGLPVPAMITLCDVMWMTHPERCRKPGPWGAVETRFFQHGIRRTLRDAIRIHTISDASKREIGKLAPSGAARTSVLPFGVADGWRPAESEADRAAAAAAARQKWVPGAARYVLTVGQYAGYKNHEGVIRAFSRAFDEEPGMHLALVQRLGQGSRLLDLIRDEGLEGRVHFLKNVPQAELQALFWGATCLCHPSFEEGFGNPPCEALGSGLPVVTSNVSSMPEVSGDAALLVDPHDVDEIAAALQRIAGDPDLAAELRARGLVRAQIYQWRHTAEDTLAVYREIAAETGRS
ncbi:MAG: glycosyltransferase family 4 protein [Myxococcales bacterium]|nr:glycosyltransferase family 4 protein [Myxococcales bacterium]